VFCPPYIFGVDIFCTNAQLHSSDYIYIHRSFRLLVLTYLFIDVTICLTPCHTPSVVRYPRYFDRPTYRRYLRDDTSIAKVTIYRGIS